MSQSDYDYLFKVVLIGNSSVGKTSLMRRFTDNHFDGDTQKATVGVQFEVVMIPLQSGKKAKLQIWDTAGQERFRAISSAYYRGAHSIIIVFGVNDRKSFDDVSSWLGEAKTHHPELSPPSNEDSCEEEDLFNDSRVRAPQVFLFGNKCDLAKERVIKYKEAQQYANAHNMIYKETSASIGVGVHDAFLQMAMHLEGQFNTLQNIQISKERYTLQKSTVIKLHEEEPSSPAERTFKEKNQCDC